MLSAQIRTTHARSKVRLVIALTWHGVHNNEVNMWNEDMPVVQVRVARPTDQLDRVVEFYRDGLGLQEIARFEDHDGFDGVMLGLPGYTYHLEFTHHHGGSPCPAPSRDNLLVLYIPDVAAIERVKNRLERLGYPEVEPENPYWSGRGVTIADPDGWRVVLMNHPGLSDD